MQKKVAFILIDGMRADALLALKHPVIDMLKENSSYTFQGKSVFPSITLPCHFSIFHSTVPTRHGILTNTYTPQVRPIDSLFDRLSSAEKKCGMFYTWEELRDLSRPGSLSASAYLAIKSYPDADRNITDIALPYIEKGELDAVFLYLGLTDHIGHKHGWMSDEYMKTLSTALDCVEKVISILPEDYTLILTADHGGHDRSHGLDIAEDMTIPFFFMGDRFEKGAILVGVSLLDIAPTVTDIIGTFSPREWEGKSLAK